MTPPADPRTLRPMVDEIESPGWRAIDAALTRLYGEVAPRHYAPAVPAIAGGNDPLDGVSVYPSTFGGRPHWHYVTYGFTELHEKESEDPGVSGFGFELTVRVIDPESVDEPPRWPLSLLQNLARYVFRTGNVFGPGHKTTLNGPIALGRDTKLTAAAFTLDPELPPIDSPHGAVEFLTLVGLTDDEYVASKDWDTGALLAVFAEKDPALVSDLARPSFLDDPEVRRRVDEGIARDGSAMDLFFATRGAWEPAASPPVLGVAANALDDLRRLVGRLALGKTGQIVWPEGMITLAAGAETGAAEDTLTLTPDDQRALAELPCKRGDYPLPSGRLVARVIPVEIKDGEGKRVVSVVG